MAQLTIQDVARTGLNPSFSAVSAGGDTVQNNGAVFFRVKTTHTASIAVTVSVFQQVDGQSVTARTVTVPANTGDVLIGPFPPAIYSDPATGLVTVTCSPITATTIAALRLPSN